MSNKWQKTALRNSIIFHEDEIIKMKYLCIVSDGFVLHSVKGEYTARKAWDNPFVVIYHSVIHV